MNRFAWMATKITRRCPETYPNDRHPVVRLGEQCRKHVHHEGLHESGPKWQTVKWVKRR